MKKLASLLLIAIAVITMASCNKEGNDADRISTMTESTVTHVLDGSNSSATATLGQTMVTINRTQMKTSFTTEVTLDGTKYTIALNDLATTGDSERGIFTFTAASASSGNNTITDLTGTYNYYLDVVTLSYTVDSRYRVNTMNNSIIFQYGSTEAKCDTATFTQEGAIYNFTLKDGFKKANLGMLEMRVNKSEGMIDRMEYEDVDVATTVNGFEITATDHGTVTDFKKPENYTLKTAKFEINMSAATMSGEFTIPGYSLKASATLYKPAETSNK